MPHSRFWIGTALLAGFALLTPLSAQDPKAEEKKADAPKVEAPKADAPKADAPKADAPKADAPKADAPKADPPKTETPPAGDKVELKWKLEKDKKFYQEVTTKTLQKMKGMGMEVNQTQEQTFYFSYEVKEEDKDKNTVLLQKIEGVKLKIDIANNPISFDSTNPSTSSNTLSDFFKALVGSEFKLTLGKDMKVIKVEGRDEFLKKLSTANQQMEPLLKKILNEDALKQMADPTFGLVPPNPVAKGESWSRPVALNLGPIGSYKNTYKYTFTGLDDKNKDLANVKVDTTLAYEVPAESADGLPFKIKQAKLTPKDATGSIVFDIKKGRLEKSDLKIKLDGELTIDIAGTTTKVDLSQDQSTTVTTSDTPQIKKAG